MSGTISLPDAITISQTVSDLCVSISVAGGIEVPAGAPPYPLAANPGETWVLEDNNGTLAWVQVQTSAPVTLSCPSTGNAGVPMAVTGTVNPPGDAVVFALGTSNIVPPVEGFVAAANTAGVLSGSVTPEFCGTAYMWAIDQVTGKYAVSGPITVAPGVMSLTVNMAGSAALTHGASGTLEVSGAVSPPQAASLQAALSASNTSPPTSGWTAASLSAGQDVWTAYLPIPATAGAYYVWVETTAGSYAVASSFTISVN